jgi:hypothetical protein
MAEKGPEIGNKSPAMGFAEATLIPKRENRKIELINQINFFIPLPLFL